MASTKIILESKSGYIQAHDQLLKSLLGPELRLFCAVGKDCKMWEDAMDFLCESSEPPLLAVCTTSHPGESVEQVLEFATNWPEAGEIQRIAV